MSSAEGEGKGGSGFAARAAELALLLAAHPFAGAELAADVDGEEEGGGAEGADEDDGGYVHTLQALALRSWRPSLR